MKARSSLSVIVFAARMPGTHHPYARCSSPAYPILGRHLHRDRKTTTALHPVLTMNKAVKQKGEAGEGGRFYVNNIFRWTKTSFRGNFQNEMIRSNRNNRCQIIFKTLLNPFWQDNYLTLLIDFSKVRFPPDKTLIL